MDCFVTMKGEITQDRKGLCRNSAIELQTAFAGLAIEVW
jgi:hypothetical protein